MNAAKSIAPGTFVTVAGGLIIVLAAVSFGTDMPPEALFNWARQVFGWGFVSLFALLCVLAIIAFRNLKHTHQVHYWHEVGQQTGNGIATLALTLLGISLGIGSLAEQTLSPDSINQIISGLTAQFSMAFMTTVVGLPTATLVRAMMSVRYQSVLHPCGD